MRELAIDVRGLIKSYRSRPALAGIDLAVPAGSVLGLLGPNGSGKTTTIRVLATLLSADAGVVMVAGHDARRSPHQVRRCIGVTGQDAAVDQWATGRQNLVFVGRLLGLSRRGAQARAKELLDRFVLGAAADCPVSTYSGGMRRRLDLAACLLNQPAVVFLDEPTTGLDPASRGMLWQEIRQLVSGGVSVLLTTQYLDEADNLADEIVILDHGSVVGRGSPRQLKALVGSDRLELRTGPAADVALLADQLVERLRYTAATVNVVGRTITVGCVDGVGPELLHIVAGELAERQPPIESFGIERPSLDDVLGQLTSRTTKA